MTAIAVLSNPLSRRNRIRGGRELADLRAVAAAAGVPHVEARDPEAWPQVLARLAQQPVDVLAINGGDGTVVAVVTALRSLRPFAREPALAVLAGGTTNMIAGDLGLPGRPAAALQRLLGARGAWTRKERAPLRVEAAGMAPRLGFFLATAAIPRVTGAAQRRLVRRGLAGPLGWRLALAASLLRLLRGRLEGDPLLRPEPVALSCDGATWRERRAVLLFVTTLETLVLGLRPLPPGAGLGVAGLLAPYSGLAGRLPALLRRPWPPGERDGVLACRTEALEMRSAAEWVLDGEPLPVAEGAPLAVAAGTPLHFVTA